MERTSLITFVVYLKHNNKAYLFIEAPNGLPPKEEEGTNEKDECTQYFMCIVPSACVYPSIHSLVKSIFMMIHQFIHTFIHKSTHSLIHIHPLIH